MTAGENTSLGPHLLWSRTNGAASLWTIDSSGKYISHRYYGPIPDLTAMDYQRFVPGFFCVLVPSCSPSAKMLWARNDGLAIIWDLDQNDNVVSLRRYGPFDGWTSW